MRTTNLVCTVALLTSASVCALLPATAWGQELTRTDDDRDTLVSPPPRLQFALGFASLKEQLGDVMGEPIELEHPPSTPLPDDATQVVQLTTRGLAHWLDGRAPAFTDGWHTWQLEAPGGVQQAASVPSAPALFGAIARADCIIGKESGGQDIPNRQGSPARGPGQYFPGTWDAHESLYRQATGYTGPLSLHSLADVRRVMAYVLTLPGQRTHWVVGGC